MTRDHQIIPQKSILYLGASVYDVKSNRIVYSVKIPSDNGAPEKIAEAIVKYLKKNKIPRVVYNRRQYRYHGKIRQIAEQIKKQGIII